jgi:hypothetical protein
LSAFFEALSIYTDLSISRKERLLEVAYIMFSMNTKGRQRKKTLFDYENSIKSMFSDAKLFEQTLKKVTINHSQRMQRIVQNQKNVLDVSDSFFVGLVVGDGCFGCDFDMRHSRKWTVRKAFSISLLKTKRNEELLDGLAKKLNVCWIKRPSTSGRHSFKIEKQSHLTQLQRFFALHASLLPPEQKKHLQIWFHIDLLKKWLTNKIDIVHNKDCIIALIEQIYYCHQGTYRRYKLSEIVEKWKKDYLTKPMIFVDEGIA